MYPTKKISQSLDFFDPFDFDFFTPWTPSTIEKQSSRHLPRTNVRHNDTAYFVEMAVPGMSRNDLNITLNDEGNLVVKMQHQQKSEEQKKEQGRYLRREFSEVNFEQTYVLPDDVEKQGITAAMADGILTITLPKIKEEKPSVARQINID